MGEGFGTFLPFIAIFAVMYFFMIAPQMKRAKQERKFASELKKGDKIITKSGMYGRVLEINDANNSCVIETMAGKIRFDKSAISMEMSKKLNAPAPKK